jgi:hypothetical protein
MITSTGGLRQAFDQLSRTYRALAGLQADHPTASPEWLAVMAEGFLDHARQLHREIEAYTATARNEEQADVWLVIEGPGIGEGSWPASVLTALLDALRKGVQAVLEFGSASAGGCPATALKEVCDWQIIALTAGSLRVGLRFPDVTVQPGPRATGVIPEVRRAAQEFFEAAWAASEESDSALVVRYPDAARRRLLNAVRPLVPRPRGKVERLTVSGRAVSSGPISITCAALRRIDQAIDQTVTGKVEQQTGDLREIDLDDLTVIIRNIGDDHEVRCTLDESLLEAAKEALDCRVRIWGVRRGGTGRRRVSMLQIFRLEVIEETASAENGMAAEDAGAA